MDLNTIFLNGDIDDEINMEQLEGYVILGNEQNVW